MKKSTMETVALLSGVNSGGKTSLLDLIAQIVILAHMGLPVPAKSCRLCIFQEMYYFSKSRGTLSAGAFETAMKKFAVVENQKRKLVLADELEAITEPGASARIIACMLDELNRRDSVAVFVSHLADEVRRFAETSVRVDGIEAEGLDENNNLKVNRSPRYNYLGEEYSGADTGTAGANHKRSGAGVLCATVGEVQVIAGGRAQGIGFKVMLLYS